MRKITLITAITLLAAMAKGEAYGGIDVGSRAVRARLFLFQGNGEGRNAKEIYSKTITTSLATSMSAGKFSGGSLKEASVAVAALLGDMMEIARNQKLGEVQYFILGSSSVAGASNRDDLRKAIAEQTGGFGITFIDSKTEGYHALRSAVPEPRRAESLMIDTGTTSTMAGCVVAQGDFRSADVPYGVVSIRNEAIDEPNYDAAVGKTIDGKIRPLYRKEVLNNPCFANRQRIYWLGPVAWAAATMIHPEKSLNAYVVLTRKDLDDMLVRLKSPAWQAMPKVVLTPDAERQRAAITEQSARDWKVMQDSFVREDLVAGVTLFRSLLDYSNPGARVIYARGGNYLYGYALEHYVESKALAPKSQSAEHGIGRTPAKAQK